MNVRLSCILGIFLLVFRVFGLEEKTIFHKYEIVFEWKIEESRAITYDSEWYLYR